MGILSSVLGGEKGKNGIGSRAKDNLSGISSFRFEYSAMRATNYTYLIEERDRKIVFVFESYEYRDYGEMQIICDPEIIEELGELYRKYRIAEWDGYDKYNTKILDGMVVSGTFKGNYKLTIAAGATVTLHNVTLTNTSTSAIRCEGDATIILSGENDVTCSKEFNAIVIPKDHLLTIKGSGTLTATGGKFGAIGGGDPEHPDEIGTVIIENPSKVTQVTHN